MNDLGAGLRGKQVLPGGAIARDVALARPRREPGGAIWGSTAILEQVAEKLKRDRKAAPLIGKTRPISPRNFDSRPFFGRGAKDSPCRNAPKTLFQQPVRLLYCPLL